MRACVLVWVKVCACLHLKPLFHISLYWLLLKVAINLRVCVRMYRRFTSTRLQILLNNSGNYSILSLVCVIIKYSPRFILLESQLFQFCLSWSFGDPP